MLDADGLIVAPGFVDLHTHYDAQIQWDPWCTISGWHGVTSVALGNCGFGFAPVRPTERERAMLTMSRLEAIPLVSMREGMLWDWETFPEWMRTLERIPKGVNCLSYVPLAPLMIYVMGLEEAKRRPAASEMARMLQLMDESLDAGACGWSAQRTGAHSIQADYDGTPMVTDTMTESDLLAFAPRSGARGEGFIQLTNATGDLQKDLRLCEDVAVAAGRPVLFNVVLAVNGMEWVHKMFVDWLESCHARGIPMFGQANSIRAPFRFTFEDWNLFDSSPAWNKALTGSHEDKKRKLKDPELVRAMAAEHDGGLLQTPILGGPISGHVFEGAKNAPALDRFIGRTVGEIARGARRAPGRGCGTALARERSHRRLPDQERDQRQRRVRRRVARLAIRDSGCLRRRCTHEVPDRRARTRPTRWPGWCATRSASPWRRRTTSSRISRRGRPGSATAARLRWAGRPTWWCTTSRGWSGCRAGGTRRSRTTSPAASGGASSARRATTTRW